MSFIQTANGTTAAAPTSNDSVKLTGVGANNSLIFQAVYTNSTGNVPTPTDSANQAWTVEVNTGYGNATSFVAYLLNANAGNHALTWNLGGSPYIAWTLTEFPQSNGINVLGGQANLHGNGTTITACSITTNGRAAIFAYLASNDPAGVANQGIVGPTGFTNLFTYNDTQLTEGGAFGYLESAGTITQNAVFTFNAQSTGADYIAQIIAFNLPATGTLTLVPIATLNQGNWLAYGCSTLYGVLANANNDFIMALGNVTGNAGDCTFQLTSAANPGSTSNHILSYAIAGTGNLTVDLMQNASAVIASWNHTPMPSTITTFNQTLTSNQAANITNYGNLSLQFIAS